MPSLTDRFRAALAEGENVVVEAIQPDDLVMSFARSASRGLSAPQKWLECRFLYDARGSELFDLICQQPEYYQTRTEAAILRHSAPEIRSVTGPMTLIELGSGSGEKTQVLLAAYVEDHPDDHVQYVPIDVSGEALEQVREVVTDRHPEVQVAGINGTYESAFPFFSVLSPAMVLFLGSTVGNLNEEESSRFWSGVSRHMPVGDYFLLGVDLVKDVTRLEAAYNDRAGVTALFTRNIFERMNRELDSGIDVDAVEHVARWDPEGERMEMFGRFDRAQDICIGPLGETHRVEAGEEIMTEISRKFRLEHLIPELEARGFETTRSFSDPENLFAVLLLRRAGGA